MRRAVLVTAILLTVFLAQVVVVEANPYRELGSVPPDIYTKPPPITVFSPQNGSTYYGVPVPLSINVSFPQSSTALGTILFDVLYKADWQKNQTYAYINLGYDNSVESQIPGVKHQYFVGDFNLTDVPDGNHSIIITAVAGGFYDAHTSDFPSFYRFMINSSATVFFTNHNSPVSSISPLQTPSVPEFPMLTIPILLIVIVAGLLVYFKKHKPK